MRDLQSSLLGKERRRSKTTDDNKTLNTDVVIRVVEKCNGSGEDRQISRRGSWKESILMYINVNHT